MYSETGASCVQDGHQDVNRLIHITLLRPLDS
jgi:hypothetical protein